MQHPTIYKSEYNVQQSNVGQCLSTVIRLSASGLSGSEGLWVGLSEPTSSDALGSPLKVQLPVVGVSSPSCAVWKSPNSPKPSNDESSISSEKDEVNVKGSEPLAAAESENGPNVSYKRTMVSDTRRLDEVIIADIVARAERIFRYHPT